ncbi:MAG: 50S ribosomal protein L5 [Candidatus Omnitrophica bacterium]|nr:50S ribosomal protein L5 [Candidatus Omnitrophota bacterium]MCB9747659.1 50S ribosomal protein L5 [Candidatus Omnitrophota bacterium]
MENALFNNYKEKVVPVLQEKFGIKNIMAVPRIQKVVINMGVGRAISDIKILESAMKDLRTITGQQPVMTRSKKAISNFKLREDLPIGCKVTLRRVRMYEFLERFISVCLPRIRDFNGVSRKSFDYQGNYSIGISDQSIFPEVDTGKLAHSQGMDITIVFNRGPKEHTFELLSLLGMPFRKN